MEDIERLRRQVADLEERLQRQEELLKRLLGDEAIGNVLKGPFRLPRRAFQ